MFDPTIVDVAKSILDFQGEGVVCFIGGDGLHLATILDIADGTDDRCCSGTEKFNQPAFVSGFQQLIYKDYLSLIMIKETKSIYKTHLWHGDFPLVDFELIPLFGQLKY